MTIALPLRRFLPVLALVVGTACGDARSVNAPPPVPSGAATRMLLARVDDSAGTVTFEPLESSPDAFGAPSPAIYGSQNVTINVHSTSFSIDSTTTPGTKVWSIGVGLRNLEAYPIGSNYGAVAPRDTMGVFVLFSSLPVVTLPSGCGCTVTVTNPMGSRNFTNPSQPFYWYNSRLQAKQVTASTDTTKNNPIWKFTGPKAVHAFTFVILVNAAWPRPFETQWSVTYDGTADSLPNTQGKPHWNFDGILGGGTESWSASGLQLAAAINTDAYLIRNDSVNAAMPLVYSATLSVSLANNGLPENVFGFGDPKMVMVGVSQDKVGFVTYSLSTFLAQFTGPTYTFPGPNGTALHAYRLLKYGTDSAVLCVDGARQLKVTYASLPGIVIGGATVLFGTNGQTGGSQSLWKSSSFTLGATTLSCS